GPLPRTSKINRSAARVRAWYRKRLYAMHSFVLAYRLILVYSLLFKLYTEKLRQLMERPFDRRCPRPFHLRTRIVVYSTEIGMPYGTTYGYRMAAIRQ